MVCHLKLGRCIGKSTLKLIVALTGQQHINALNAHIATIIQEIGAGWFQYFSES